MLSVGEITFSTAKAIMAILICSPGMDGIRGCIREMGGLLLFVHTHSFKLCKSNSTALTQEPQFGNFIYYYNNYEGTKLILFDIELELSQTLGAKLLAKR